MRRFTLTADIVNNGIVRGALAYVWRTGGFMLMVCALFRKTQEFSAGDFGKFGAASLITRSTNDVTQVQTAFSIMERRN